MTELSILQKGNIYFFYTPRTQHQEAHNLEEVQKFFMIMKPENASHYITLVVGRKHLPENATYFSFVTKISANIKALLSALTKKDSKIHTQEITELTEAHCLGLGTYLIIDHDGHTHLYYELNIPSAIGSLQEQFNLKKHGDYVVSIKNPNQHSPPGVGLPSTQKAKYPVHLQDRLGDYRFFHLNPPDFINYKGAELLLISQKMSDMEEKDSEINTYLRTVSNDDFAKYLKEVDGGIIFTDIPQ
jgi:hypothetical protein